MPAMAREAEMFGEALKRWREKRGLTQEALAHEAPGCRRTRAARWRK